MRASFAWIGLGLAFLPACGSADVNPYGVVCMPIVSGGGGCSCKVQPLPSDDDDSVPSDTVDVCSAASVGGNAHCCTSTSSTCVCSLVACASFETEVPQCSQ